MKSILGIWILFLFSPFQVFAGDFQGTHCTLEPLNLRSAPSVTSEALALLKPGTDVQILEEGPRVIIDSIEAPWVRVQTPAGVRGWCFSGYLGVLEVKAGVLVAYQGHVTHLTVPANRGITAIGPKVFYQDRVLEEVIFPPGIKSLGAFAFSYSEIQRVRFGAGLEEIGEGAFDGSHLKSIELPSTLKIIRKGAFSFSLLKTISLPSQVTTLEEYAFDNSDLKEIRIPASVKEIGPGALAGENLETITLDPGNPYFKLESGVLLTQDLSRILCYPPKKPQEVYTLPPSVKSIQASSFARTTQLKKVLIPEGFQIIPPMAFWDCSLVTISIPSSVQDIGSEAFSVCKKLKEIEIPPGIQVIKTNTFSGCENLERVQLPKSVTQIQTNAFANCRRLKDVSWPSSLTTIGDFAFSSCDSLVSLEIPASVTAIGIRAFSFCKNLTQVKIAPGDRRLTLSGQAFCKNPLLAFVSLPSRVQFQWDYAYGYHQFEDCKALIRAEVSRTLKLQDAFEGCPVKFTYLD